LPGAPGMSRSVNAATVEASSLLKNAPSPGPPACEWVGGGTVPVVLGVSWVCASALGTSVAPATAPAPTAAPSRNARRASSCLVICDSSCGAFLRRPAEYWTSRTVIVLARSTTAPLTTGQLTTRKRLRPTSIRPGARGEPGRLKKLNRG